MRTVERPYASRALSRVGFVLFVLACLLAQGCGKTRLTVPGGSRAGSGSAVIATAKAQIGKPYKYGGTTPQTGFDCSGLIQWSYRQHGIYVPRLAKDQAACGKTVSKSQLQPGDIVVFRISPLAGIHTGLYSGNGKFVHSPSSGKYIREESMNTAYWKQRYVAARRVF